MDACVNFRREVHRSLMLEKRVEKANNGDKRYTKIVNGNKVHPYTYNKYENPNVSKIDT